MSYTMQGVVGDAHLLAATAIGPTVPLAQGKALLLFTDRLRDQHALPFLPLTDEAAPNELPEPIRRLCARLSANGQIAYIEAELFGGQGTQAAALWNRGQLVQPPLIAREAINEALRALGVQVTTGVDEFAALALGTHRDIEDWGLAPALAAIQKRRD